MAQMDTIEVSYGERAGSFRHRRLQRPIGISRPS
jgi:hypothetical protein